MSYSEAYSNPKKEEEGVSCIDIRTAQRLLKQRIWIASQDNHTTHVRENTTTTTTNVPTRKSVPRSNRQLDHMKTSWSSLRDAHCKPILQGTVKGGRRQGRQRKKWKDSIWEWTGLEFTQPQRAVENREKWRKLFAKSSVVPQRPSRFRDWWWWWWWWWWWCSLPPAALLPSADNHDYCIPQDFGQEFDWPRLARLSV